MNHKCYILGAGITGLAAGWASGLPIFESVDTPGGICSSYYVRPGDVARLHQAPADEEAYHFEIGGGHWIFGSEPAVLRFIRSLTPIKTYQRRSSVFFAGSGQYVPYPLQNHLRYLDQAVATRALTEIATQPKATPLTMAEWLAQSFGATLSDRFFTPFHERYTAGLWTSIAPQDAYKSPVELSQVLSGAFEQVQPVGYNVSFVYPVTGLNSLAQRMAHACQLGYGKTVTHIDLSRREFHFADGTAQAYDSLISTLPLNKMMVMTGLEVDAPPDPYTSVLVLNIGARRGAQCPDDHWLYNSDAQAGFHRVGFYSNVDAIFLPKSARTRRDRVSIYVERAYEGGRKPSPVDMAAYTAAVIQELQAWQFIEQVEVVDPTWIDVAYTWSWPGSKWRTLALQALEQHQIYQVGRYGRWVFQGIADSLKDGFVVGSAFKSSEKAS